MSDRIRVTLVDLMGSKYAEVSLPAALTASEVIQKLTDSNFLENVDEEAEPFLQVQDAPEAIGPGESLKAAGVQEGDVLWVDSMPGGRKKGRSRPDDTAKSRSRR